MTFLLNYSLGHRRRVEEGSSAAVQQVGLVPENDPPSAVGQHGPGEVAAARTGFSGVAAWDTQVDSVQGPFSFHNLFVHKS